MPEYIIEISDNDITEKSELVRCYNCKHYHQSFGCAMYFEKDGEDCSWNNPNDFCSWGEKRE